MKEINAPENRSLLLNTYFDKKLNYIEILDWIDEKMTWVPEGTPFTRYESPFLILENGTGKGRCGEHAIVFSAVCLAHGYEVRFVSAFFCGDHAWVEVKENNKWIHIDPSPSFRVNETNAYASKFFLVVYGYQTDGKTVYLANKYNPILKFFIIGLIVLIFVTHRISRYIIDNFTN